MKKIMIVDDEQEIVEMMKIMLESDGFETIECFSGNECLEKLKYEKPDLILLDIMMKPMGGWETLEIIKNNVTHKEMPVSVVSAIDLNNNEIKNEVRKKIEDYIVKPFTKKDLINSINKVFNGKKL